MTSKLGAIREQYAILIGADPGISLCMFCRFAEWEKYSCDACFAICAHPLEAVRENAEDSGAFQGFVDCWGFRPDIAHEDAVDIAGIILRGQRVDWDTVPIRK
jgi:hypothetical protein